MSDDLICEECGKPIDGEAITVEATFGDPDNEKTYHLHPDCSGDYAEKLRSEPPTEGTTTP